MNNTKYTISKEVLVNVVRCLAKANSDNAFEGCVNPNIGVQTITKLMQEMEAQEAPTFSFKDD